MTIKNKILSAFLAIPLALGVAGGIQAEQLHQGDVFMVDENGNTIKKLAPDTATAEIDVTNIAPYVATPAETSQYEVQTPKQQKRNLNVLKNIKGPTLKEIVKQYEKEDAEKARQKKQEKEYFSVLYGGEAGYKSINEVFENKSIQGTQETKKVEGLKLKGHASVKGGKDSGFLEGYSFKIKGKTFDAYGDYHLNEGELAILAGRDDKDETNGIQAHCRMGYWQKNTNVSGKITGLDGTYSKRTGLEGFILEAGADLGNVAPGLSIELEQKFGQGPQTLNTNILGNKNTEIGTAKEDITTISGSYDLGNLTKNKYLQFKVKQDIEFKNQEATSPSGYEAFNYVTYRIAPKYILSMENMRIVFGAEYARSWMTNSSNPGIKLNSSDEWTFSLGAKADDKFIEQAGERILALFNKGKGSKK